MKWRFQWSVGLLGRILAILLLAIVVEFGISTALYERASEFSVREDEARRLAEHLVIAGRLVAERPPSERTDMARRVTTERYHIRWSASLPPPPPTAEEADQMRRQILAWEPSLASSTLRLRIETFRSRSAIVGGLTLADGSWLYFRTLEPVYRWDLVVGRVARSVILALFLIVLGSILIRRTLRPMRLLADAAEKIGHGSAITLVEAGPAEVRNVIQAFNAMQDRIHWLIEDRTQALAAVGHDLRTPLSRLQLRVDEIGDPSMRSAMGQDVTEMEAMVESLLAYLGGENDPESPAQIDLAVLCATLVDDAEDRGRSAHYEGPDHLDLSVRPIGFKRALVNLVENALHYGEEATIVLAEADGQVTIRVEDDGPGIPEEAIAEAMRPFSRLDAERGRNTTGLGLGLAIVDRAVALEGGAFRLSNRPVGGLVAEIVLPRR